MNEIFCFVSPFQLKQTVYMDKDEDNAVALSHDVALQELADFMLESAVSYNADKIRLVGEGSFVEGYKEQIIGKKKSNPKFSNQNIIVEVNK